jgi:hypothetical protein
LEQTTKTEVTLLVGISWACPRNLTGRMQDWERTKDKYAKSWDQVGWVLWWRHTTASTTSSEFIIYSSKQASGIGTSAGQQFSGWA